MPAAGSRLSGIAFADDPLVGDELVQAGVDQLPIDLQDLRGLADHVRLGEVAVPVIGGLGERVLQPGFDPLRGVVRDPDRLGDRVGGLKADPPHFRGQPVGLAAHHRDRVLAVALVDPHRQRRGYPDAGQEHHHFLDRLLLLPCVGDPLGPFGSQPVHLDQPLGLLFDDGQDVGAEMRHHPLGHHRPDPLDQPGAQVAADALDRRRQHRRVGVHLKLLAVFGMAAPAPGQA